MENQINGRRIGLAVILILAGTLLLLKNLGMLPYELISALFNWQMLLIVIGVLSMLNRANKTPGVILIIIGGYFWLERYYNLDLYWMRDYWPVFIILIGVSILFRHGVLKKIGKSSPETVKTGDSIDELAVFSGSEAIVTSQNFDGGKVTSIFGGADVNLKNAQPLADHKAVIEVFCLFGGITLHVPNDWTVHTEVSPIFGGFSDERPATIINPDPRKVLVVKGTILFGGGEIKSV